MVEVFQVIDGVVRAPLKDKPYNDESRCQFDYE